MKNKIFKKIFSLFMVMTLLITQVNNFVFANEEKSLINYEMVYSDEFHEAVIRFDETSMNSLTQELVNIEIDGNILDRATLEYKVALNKNFEFDIKYKEKVDAQWLEKSEKITVVVDKIKDKVEEKENLQPLKEVKANGTAMINSAVIVDKDNGTTVANIIAGTNAAQLADKIYYLQVEVSKSVLTATDDWVTIDLGYGLEYAGGLSDSAVGDIAHTYLSALIERTKRAETWGIQPNNGSVTFKIKPDVDRAIIELPIRVDGLYSNANPAGDTLGSSALPIVKITSGSTIGVTDDDKTLNNVVYKYDRGTTAPHPTWPNGSVISGKKFDDNITARHMIPIMDGATVLTNDRSVFKSMSLKITYAKGAEINLDGWTLGAETDNPDGTASRIASRYDFTRNGSVDSICFNVKFPSNKFSYTAGRFTSNVVLSDFNALVYNDDENFNIYRGTNYSLSHTFNLVDPALDLSDINGHNFDVGNWASVSSKTNTVLGIGNILNNGSADTLPKTIEVTMDKGSNAVIHAVMIPYFAGADTVTFTTRKGVTKTVDLPDLAKTDEQNTSIYELKANEQGLDEDDSFITVKANIGVIPAGFLTLDDGTWRYTANSQVRLVGSVKSANTTTLMHDYYIYNTGTAGRIAKTQTITMKNPEVSIGGSNISNITAVAGSKIVVDGSIGNQGYNYNNSAFLLDPVVYLTLPKEISYSNIVFKNNNEGSELDYDIEEITSSATSAPTGMKVYKVTLKKEGYGVGFYDSSTMERNTLFFSLEMFTSPSATNQTFYWNDLVSFGSKHSNLVTFGSLYGSVPKPDKYGINGGKDLGGFETVTNSYLNVTENKTVVIENSMKITTDGTSTDWINYQKDDPINSTAFVNERSTGEYRLTLTNNTGDTVNNLTVYVPLPKKDLNLGTAYMPQSQEFDISILNSSLPSGFSIQYAKALGTYATGTVADDAQICPVEEANIAILTYAGNFLTNEQKEIILNFEVADHMIADEILGKINSTLVNGKYSANGSDFILTGSPMAMEYADGNIEGALFNDINRNGKKDIGDSAIANHMVKMKDSLGIEKKVLTDANGNYHFGMVRNSIENREVQVVVSTANDYTTDPTITSSRKFTVLGEDSNMVANSTNDLASLTVECTSVEPLNVSTGLMKPIKLNYSVIDENSVSSNVVTYGWAKEVLLDEPTPILPIGYVFDRWYVDNGYQNQLTNNTIPSNTANDEVTLYGRIIADPDEMIEMNADNIVVENADAKTLIETTVLANSNASATMKQSGQVINDIYLESNALDAIHNVSNDGGIYTIEVKARFTQAGVGYTHAKAIKVIVKGTNTDMDTPSIDGETLIIQASDFILNNKETITDAEAIAKAKAIAFMLKSNTEVAVSIADSEQMNAINQAPEMGGIYPLMFQAEYTTNGVDYTKTMEVNVIVKGSGTEVDEPDPFGETLIIHAKNILLENGSTLTADEAVVKAEVQAYMIKSGEVASVTLKNHKQLDAINQAQEDGGTYPLTFKATHTINGKVYEKEVSIQVSIKGNQTTVDGPDNTGEGLVIGAKNVLLENGSTLTIDEAIVKAQAQAYMIKSGTVVAVTLKDQQQLSTINQAQEDGGAYPLIFKATHTINQKVYEKELSIQVLVKGKNASIDSPDELGEALVLTAKNFIIDNGTQLGVEESIMKTLTMETTDVIAKAEVKAYMLKSGVEIPVVLQDMNQLKQINEASKNGGVYPLSFVAEHEQNGKKYSQSLNIFVTVKGEQTTTNEPDEFGEMLIINANSMVLNNGEKLTSKQAIDKTGANAFLMKSGITCDIDLNNENELTAINNSGLAGGIYPLTFVAKKQKNGKEYSGSVTVNVVVKGTHVNVDELDGNKDKLIIQANDIFLQNEERLNEQLLIERSQAKAFMLKSGNDVDVYVRNTDSLKALENVTKDGGYYHFTLAAKQVENDHEYNASLTIKVTVKDQFGNLPNDDQEDKDTSDIPVVDSGDKTNMTILLVSLGLSGLSLFSLAMKRRKKQEVNN